MWGPFSIESAVRLVSHQIDEKLKSANDLVTELMNHASVHGDQKLQSIQLVVNEVVKLVSNEMDVKMKVANLIATDAMLLGASELEKKINLANSVVDFQRRKLLSSAVALVYFTLLLAYALYSRPSLKDIHDTFLALQFAILGLWIADLVGGVNLPFLAGSTNRDGFFILTLMLAFLSFVYLRGRRETEGKGADQCQKEARRSGE